MLKKILTLGIMLTFTSFAYAQQESVTITTYYPSPYGSYKELRAQRVAIGGTYYDTSQYCWSSDTCTNRIPDAASLVVEGNVGIGTSSPGCKLHVYGSGAALTVDSSGVTNDYALVRIKNSGRAWVLQDDANSFDFYIRDETANTFPFTIKPGAPNYSIYIASNGDVGIGTPSQSAKLDVAGTIKSSTKSNFYTTTIAQLKTLNSDCDITTPTGVLMCMNSCNRYCQGLGYSGGTLVEWFDPNAGCACIP